MTATGAAGGAAATAGGGHWCRRPGYLMRVPDNRNGLTESKPISSIKHNSMAGFSDDGNHHRSPREGQGHHQG